MATTRKRAAKKLKKELAPRSDPQAPLDGAAFLSAAKPVLATLAKDLMERAEASKAITQALVARYEADKQAKRTAEAYLGWRQAFVDQVAAAWLLSCVFIRVLEDRGLVAGARIAGPGAADSQHLFFQMGPSLTERDYLWTLFRELSRTPAAEALFDPRHNPVWLLGPSGEATKALLNLFRMPSVEAPAFRFGGADTRFLGDLYQDLNDDVKKRYALLQTPRFVERFILDRTLDRAIERFGLDDATLIDPTCGSGHFLLGAFDRLFERRRQAEPGTDVRQVAIKALDAVAGSDINPYAVAIARFRLTLAFLDKAELEKLSDAPRLPLHVVVADSLLHNPQLAQQHLKDLDGQRAEAWEGELFALEDEKAAREVLYRRYSAVVGNPPYITAKDAVLRDEYRSLYPKSASGKYSLAAPFAERFFQLARDRGAVGMITANSFMKREFGKKLIQEFLPSVNLDLIINSSGAYIPGHGTPTVLLFGTNEPPQGMEAHVVLASRGEPTTPDDPEQGFVWRSIADHWSEVGFQNEHVSVAQVDREGLAKHPWSLGGGGASELKELLEDRAVTRLGDVADSIGISSVTGEDDVYLLPPDAAKRLRVGRTVPLVTGEYVRDWALAAAGECVFPFDEDFVVRPPEEAKDELRYLWPFRAVLGKRKRFGVPMLDKGLTWYELQELYANKLRTPLSITFAEVATHNHFVLDRGGKVFKQTAPIIKLPETATEDDHLALLAYLNSSTACFWMKQACHDKGNRGEGGGFTSESWERFFQFSGTALGKMPIPKCSGPHHRSRIVLARELLELAEQRTHLADLRSHFLANKSLEGIAVGIAGALRKLDAIEGAMRAAQERLDWTVYEEFGLCDATSSSVQSIGAGERASDIRFARAVLGGEPGRRYFELCRLPSAENVAKLKFNEPDGMVKILESPEYKRTYREGFRPPQAKQQAMHLLGNQLEEVFRGASLPQSVRALAASGDGSFGPTTQWLINEGVAEPVHSVLVAGAIPFLSAMRFGPTGRTKHLAWQSTWNLQRRQDAGEDVGEIPVPPKYAHGDFREPSFYRLRGKLDVAKERFISYPGCESDEDNEPVYGWAGWDHLQQAQALAALYQDRKDREGWTADRLTPMLAGLFELLPWLLQWHNEPSDEFDGLQLGDYFQSYLDEQCRELGLTLDNLRDWRPEPKGRGRKKG